MYFGETKIENIEEFKLEGYEPLPGYKYDDLKEWQKDILQGMLHILKTVIVNYVENHYIGEPDNTLEKIELEISKQVVEDMKVDAIAEINQAIVCFNDNNAVEE